MTSSFPFRRYTAEELSEEFYKLQTYKPTGKLVRRRLGYKCSNAFFQYERMNTPTKSNLTNIEFWIKFRDKVIRYNAQEGGRDLFHTLQFLNHPPSQFPPSIALELYSKFGASIVFDPFAGWGDRCLAAMAMNIDYIGVDSNPNLKLPYKEMFRFYPHHSKVRFINKPVEKVDVAKLDFDFVLTSPPFWDEKQHVIENYHGMGYSEYSEFMDEVFIPTVLRCASKANWSCYYIPKHMAEYVTKKTGLKWTRRLTYHYRGNKKYQVFSVYCVCATTIATSLHVCV
jgi:hypothetical protein